MSSGIGNIIRTLAPVAAGFIAPELAPFLGITGAAGTAALGAGLGGIGGLAGGGGLKGTLTSALAGGLGAGGGDLFAGSDGLGLTGNAASAVSKGLTGAATGFNSTGDLGGTLLGGAIGAGSGFLGNVPGAGVEDGTDLGQSATGTLANGGNAALNGTTSLDPSGYFSGASTPVPAGAFGGGGSSFAGAGGAAGAGAGSGGGILSNIGSSFSNSNGLSSLLSGGIGAYANNKAADQLEQSQQDTLAALNPFLKNGQNASNTLGDYLGTSGNTSADNYGAGTAAFNPSDLQSDPGYEFNLGQGQNALNNSFAAAGNLGSGAAIKGGQQFAQGLADTTFNNAFNRDLQTKQQNISALQGQANPGLVAAGQVGDVNNNIGSAQSKSTTGLANIGSSTLAQLLSGGGAKIVIGYDQNGKPIYQQ